MKIKISRHAVQRAVERGISEDGIRAIVRGECFAVTTPSGAVPDVVFVTGEYEGRVWTVLFNINSNNVITVRRAWRKEEVFYDEKKRTRSH